MHLGKTVFNQVMDWVHPEQFRRCVTRYQGNYKVRNFSCWEQFLAMGFAQMTFRESLADIEVCLRSRGQQLYHFDGTNWVPENWVFATAVAAGKGQRAYVARNTASWLETIYR